MARAISLSKEEIVESSELCKIITFIAVIFPFNLWILIFGQEII